MKERIRRVVCQTTIKVYTWTHNQWVLVEIKPRIPCPLGGAA